MPMPTPADELETLRIRGRGILSEALTRPVEGLHGGDDRARHAAIGQTFEAILRAWDRLHEDYAEFMRGQMKAAKEKK